MKALVYEGVKDVQVKNVGDPEIQDDEDIIVRVTTTSICGSDLHLIHGMIPDLPKGFILGHETMGIVEEAGKSVTRVRKGDRVIIPVPVSCGRCWYCSHGLWSQCDNSNPNGETGVYWVMAACSAVMKAGRPSISVPLCQCGTCCGAGGAVR